MAGIRRAAVAGHWYTDDGPQLAAEIDRYIQAATDERLAARARAIIVPHAGLMYSGPVAAYAYRCLRAQRYSAIVLVGPSHFVPFQGVSIWPDGAWETPFGAVLVDERRARAITEASDDISAFPAAHLREHSLEMQLPFLAHLVPGVPIVPMVMGSQTRTTAYGLGDALTAALQRTDSDNDAGGVLLVASSDLSHYFEMRTAAALDGVILDRIEAFDPDGLMDALEREPRHACGGGPMVSVLRAAGRLGASHARVLRYADSGDVSGDKSSVVGYAAAVMW